MKNSRTNSIIIFSALVLFLFANIVQSLIDQGMVYLKKPKYLVYYGLQISLLCYSIYRLTNLLDLNELLKSMKKFPVPIGAKWAVLIVLLGNLLSVIVGKPNYPFYDVGMFRWSNKFQNKPKTIFKPKYYYWNEGEVKILDLRKEGVFFLAEHFDLGYNHEFTFSAANHNKAQKENFEFILESLKHRGIDTLWVGIHSINYETKEILFNPDICHAIDINNSKKIHYGPIYIPDYQLEKCNEN